MVSRLKYHLVSGISLLDSYLNFANTVDFDDFPVNEIGVALYVILSFSLSLSEVIQMNLLLKYFVPSLRIFFH